MNLRFVVVALAAALSFPNAILALDIRTAAFTDQPAPGTPAGVVFSNLFYSVINDSGVVAFNGSVKGPGVIFTAPSNSPGIWAESPNGLRKIVRAGDPAVGVPAGASFGLQSGVKIDSLGRAAFLANAPGESTDGIYSEGQGMLRLTGREGDQAPGMPSGVNFYLPSVPLLNNAGQIVTDSFLRGPSGALIRESVWTDRDGDFELVLLEGDPAPGIPGANLRQINASGFNDLGVIALSGRFTGSNYPSDHAIWTENAGSFSLVARSGQTPADAPNGAVFSRVLSPHINNAGQMMFYGELTGPGIDATSDGALWKYEAGTTSLIAREGSPAVGIGSGVSYASFYSTLFNGAGQTTFVASLTGPGVTTENDTAVWTERNGALTLIAREGDQAPGANAGVRLGDLSSLGGSLGVQVNRAGQVAFSAPVTGPSVNSSNDRGLWFTDLSGTLRLIAREGELFDVNDDPLLEDWRTVNLIRLDPFSSGDEDGSTSSYNAAGELAFTMSFVAGGAGVFVASTAVPEPATIAIVGCAAAALSALRPKCSQRAAITHA
jgi:hypothetical protein